MVIASKIQLLVWHDIEKGMPQINGWYLLKAKDGSYVPDNHIVGCQWLTMRPIVAWAKL